MKGDSLVVPPAQPVQLRKVPLVRKYAVSEESMFQKARQPTMVQLTTSVRSAQPAVPFCSVREQHSHLKAENRDFGNIHAAVDLPC